MLRSINLPFLFAPIPQIKTPSVDNVSSIDNGLDVPVKHSVVCSTKAASCAQKISHFCIIYTILWQWATLVDSFWATEGRVYIIGGEREMIYGIDGERRRAEKGREASRWWEDYLSVEIERIKRDWRMQGWKTAKTSRDILCVNTILATILK